jgi:hypothetical protein
MCIEQRETVWLTFNAKIYQISLSKIIQSIINQPKEGAGLINVTD